MEGEMIKKQKSHKYIELDATGVFGNPEEMAQEIDSLLYFLQTRYTERDNEIPSMFGFIVTDLEVKFVDGLESIKLQSDLASNCMYVCTPPVEKGEEEKRRIELLNSFGETIKRNQIASIVDLLRYMKLEAKEKLISSFREFSKDSKVKRKSI